jgi:two-component system, chemotaxis family, CheB/CheR fusion protein
MVHGDSTRLQQIFWNLINNAIKFTGPDGTITVRSYEDNSSRIVVEVADTGVGIDPNVLPKLFNAFEQGEVRTAHRFAGLGLGLAISKKLVDMQGGTITAMSEGRGRGSTFRVELPAIEPTAPAPIPHRPATAPSITRTLDVLLVEDHEPTLAVLSKLLSLLGHRVTPVNTVASATSAAVRDGFDLIISDLGLPDGSGLDIMRQLREKYAGRAIALTGYGMDSDIAASREAGFSEHLTKPVDIATLQSAIDRLSNPESRRTPAGDAR